MLLYPFFIYSMFAFLPALVGIAIGVQELVKKSYKRTSAIAVAGNSALLVAYILFYKSLWPAMMGI